MKFSSLVAKRSMVRQRTFSRMEGNSSLIPDDFAGRRMVVIDEGETVRAKVVTYQDTHGLRRVRVTLALGSEEPVELTIDLDKDNAIALMDHIQSVNSFAWREGHPLDAEADETCPPWVRQWPRHDQ